MGATKNFSEVHTLGHQNSIFVTYSVNSEHIRSVV